MKEALIEPMMRAMEKFAASNENKLPTNIIIYRDGVGDAQRN